MMSDFKKFIAKLILAGLVVAALVSLYTLYVPKVWQVSGKIVIVPSGSSASANQNLALEAANAAEMINSPSFQKNVLGTDAQYFSGANPVSASSTVRVNFEGEQANIQTIEDLIARMPDSLAKYSRDIYSGSPFKYLIVSDPEVSLRPVKPNMTQNVLNGFILGAVLYVLYWLWIEPLTESMPVRKNQIEKSSVVSPSIEVMQTWEESAAEPRYEDIQIEEQPAEPETPQDYFPAAPEYPSASEKYGAPDNLPVMGAEPEVELPAKLPDYSEPSDEEVKDRLNKLMRGEL